MPLYEYKCPTCGLEKEFLQGMDDPDPYRLGCAHTEETKEKMSESAKNVDRKNYKFKKFQQRKKVMFLESGEIFISIYQASKKLGVSRSYVRKHLNTKFRLLNDGENNK